VVFEAPAGQPSHRCSASLLSPTVVLTAGHCTDGTAVARVWFDENLQNNSEYPFGGATSYEGVPYTNPDFCIGCGNGLPGFAQRDVGIIVLTEPVPPSVVGEYAQLPSAGLVDRLSSKAPVTLVGYGVQERIVGSCPPMWAGLRVRLMAPARLVSGSFTHSDEFVRVTVSPGQGGGTCFGDSGGPILNDNTDTVQAVNSYVTGIVWGQAPPFGAGLARPARGALLAEVRPEGPQRCATSRGRERRRRPQVPRWMRTR
jgi:hypothetical protein